MFFGTWKKELFTIPNLLSLSRILLLPLYVGIYTKKQYFTARILMALSCLTDAFDGAIARKWNMISNVGKILDPIADKLTQLTLTITLDEKPQS